MVNPVAFGNIVHTGYKTHPDHKGAAAFIMQQRLGPNDIIVAEDVLQQTYYLGHVDYWLQSRDAAVDLHPATSTGAGSTSTPTRR